MAGMMTIGVKLPQSMFKRTKRWGTFTDAQGKEFIPQAQRLMQEDNRQGLLASTDKYGRPLKELATSTLLRRHFTLSTKPLIPHGAASRAIANYKTTPHQQGEGVWMIIGSWPGVVSKTGVAFMGFHIEGLGHNPVRDIAGVRPEGVQKISQAYRVWLHDFMYK